MRQQNSTEQIGWSFAREHGLTVGDEMLMAIGATVVCQSRIEAQLALFIERFTNLEDERGAAITAEMSFRALSTVLSTLVLDVLSKDSKRYKKFADLMGQLKHFEEFRNQVAHSIWKESLDLNNRRCAVRTKLTAKQAKGVRLHIEDVEIAHISREVNGATQTMIDLITLIDDVLEASRKSPTS